LNISIVSDVLISKGKLFQSLGVHAAKALSPNVKVFV